MISKLLVLGVALAATVGGAAAGAATGSAPEGKREPAIMLLSETPVALRGSGFKPRERVALRVVVANRTFTKSVRSTPAGTFTARFTQAERTECDPLSAIATGGSGSRAMLARKIDIPPACGMSPQPGTPPTQP